MHFCERDSKLSSNGLCKALFASIENDAVKGDSRKGESAQEAKTEIGAHSKLVQNEMFRIIEHPLLTFIFMYQIYSQKWARNGRAMLIQLLYFRNHYWHDYTVQMDFFLIQLAASICPGEKFISMLLARFEVGRGLNKKQSPYLDASSSLFVPGASKYVTTLRNSPKFDRYFPHLEVCIHESDSWI